MAKVPATELSLEYLRGRGFIADVVERRIPMKPFPKTKDLFDFIDIVAVNDRTSSSDEWNCNAMGVVFVQTTSATNKSARVHKMEQPEIGAKVFKVQHVGRIELHCWQKIHGRYEVAVYNIRIEDQGSKYRVFASEAVAPHMGLIRAMRPKKKRLHRG
jgi:hypothetical protein